MSKNFFKKDVRMADFITFCKLIGLLMLSFVVSACQSAQSAKIHKSFTSGHAIHKCQPTRQMIFDEQGQLISSEEKKIFAKWRIPSKTPLLKIAKITQKYEDLHCFEIHTTQGIYTILSPAYGWRRFPLPRNDFDYKIVLDDRHLLMTKNGESFAKSLSTESAIKTLCDDIANETSVGYVNLYIQFPEQASWGDAEQFIDKVLSPLDSIRGIWLGINKEGQIILHFHDLWINGWDDTPIPNFFNTKKNKQPLDLDLNLND